VKKGDLVVREAASIGDDTRSMLTAVQSSSITLSEEDLKNLKKRKLVQQLTRKSYKITKGSDYRPKRIKKVAELTKDMLGNKADMQAGSHWTDLSFRSINLKSMGAPVHGGNYHPLLKVRAEFRRILMEMGFEEMPTNKWVESSFWNFDALFQPQSHPARDAHDTFFIKDPATTRTIPEDYYEIVKQTHENGGDTGSIGYGCVFKREEAMKNLLRTHTTAISAQMLYRLAKEPGEFRPRKYFSIDRVFRNEAMDATHLCEFHQVEGLVADRNLTLGNLIAIIRTFFHKIGITQLRFKPAYNPYTEPSMEIFGYHPELKKWTEIGNSGMFRPEMLLPMGLPPDVRVIAWGLSLERPTMIKYKIENIRDLFGHKADLTKQRNAPIARF
jgi:phenylalanyl-tRNA synthetase alpha chain